MNSKHVVLSLAAALLFGSGCNDTPAPAPAAAPVTSAYDSYLKANATGYAWFAGASDGYAGVPLILMRSLSDLAPDIWGKPEEQFSRFGLFPNPGKPLPLGLSWDSMDTENPPQQLHPDAVFLRERDTLCANSVPDLISRN